jgi:hypothetical protein
MSIGKQYNLDIVCIVARHQKDSMITFPVDKVVVQLSSLPAQPGCSHSFFILIEK